VCQDGFTGQKCENYVAKERIHHDSGSSSTASTIGISFLIFVLIALAAMAFYVFLRKKNFGKETVNISSLIGGGVVSFRQGSNVEFGAADQQQLVS
jgi:hypothetical protein